MGDSMYSDYQLDMGSVKQETGQLPSPMSIGQEMGPSSASVPIPCGPRATHNYFDQFSPSPVANPALWGTNKPGDFLLEPQFKLETNETLDPLFCFKMEDEDIFQVDKADLIQGPTLAELNSHDDVLNDLNFDDLLLPSESIQSLRNAVPPAEVMPILNTSYTSNVTGFASSSFPQPVQTFKNFPQYTNVSNVGINGVQNAIDPLEAVNPLTFPSPVIGNVAGTSSATLTPHLITKPPGQSTLHELLLQKGDVGQNSPVHNQIKMIHPSGKPKISRLSMSAPTQTMGLEQIWSRREPRPHLLSTGSLGMGEAGSTSSLSTGSALSPNPIGLMDPLSHDEGYEDSDDDSDHYDDCSSDNDSGGSDNEEGKPSRLSGESPSKDGKSKREKYFWQYNVQAKGPKGQRLVARARLENPHVLNEVTDPVFSPHCALRGIKHSGKARKGDGNDLTPNPRKLHMIGKELDKLARIINDMTPVSELPFPIRPKTRKEKNKLASRACRLKKKAQHEANKIKLHGLEQEHKRLLHGISQAKLVMIAKLNETNPEHQEELTRRMDMICKSATKIRIANQSTEFVNKVLDKMKAGVPDGGIDDF